MTDRYEQLLDAVSPSRWTRAGAQAHPGVHPDARSTPRTPETRQKDKQYYVKQKMNEYKTNDGLDERDNAWMEERRYERKPLSYGTLTGQSEDWLAAIYDKLPVSSWIEGVQVPAQR